jgi:hypothetical protein
VSPDGQLARIEDALGELSRLSRERHGGCRSHDEFALGDQNIAALAANPNANVSAARVLLNNSLNVVGGNSESVRHWRRDFQDGHNFRTPPANFLNGAFARIAAATRLFQGDLRAFVKRKSGKTTPYNSVVLRMCSIGGTT